MNKTKNISREAPSQRRNYRVQSPLRILMKDKKYTTNNWSVGGFSVSEYLETPHEAEEFPIHISVSFNHFNINFNTSASIVRYDSDSRSLACKFIALDERQKELLSHFANSLLQGEMAQIDETIKRLDIPVTLVSENPDRSPSAKTPLRRKKIKSLIIGGSYLLIGAMLSLYALNAVYNNIYTLRIENATIKGQERVVKAPHSGIVHEIYKDPGDIISAREALLFVQNDQITESAELAFINVLSAKANLKEKQNRLISQKDKLASYREFGLDKLNIAKAITGALEQKINLAKRRKARLLNLYKNGMTSDESIDEIKEKIITLSADLLVARAKQKISERAIRETKKGRFYTDNRLEGEAKELVSSIDNAQVKVKLEQKKYQLLKNREERLIVKAPSGGEIISVYFNIQQIVSKGEPLLLIAQSGEREIEAFINADELATVVINKPAKIIVNAKMLFAKVVKIENSVFNENALNSSDVKSNISNLIRVTLRFPSIEDRKYVTSQPIGLPVLVEFSKRSFTDDFPQFANISNYLMSVVNADEK